MNQNWIAYQKKRCDSAWLKEHLGKFAFFTNGIFFRSHMDVRFVTHMAEEAGVKEGYETNSYKVEDPLIYMPRISGQDHADESRINHELFQAMLLDDDWRNLYVGRYVAIFIGAVAGIEKNFADLTTSMKQKYPGEGMYFTRITPKQRVIHSSSAHV